MAYPTLTAKAGASFRVRYATGYGKPIIAITEDDINNLKRDIAIFPATEKGKREAERRRDEIAAESSRKYAERLELVNGGKGAA